MTMKELDEIYGYNASGNSNWRRGLTYLAEAGPELAFLPSGTKILSAQETRQAMGGDVYIENLVLDASTIKQLNDIYDLVSSARIRSRMQGG